MRVLLLSSLFACRGCPAPEPTTARLSDLRPLFPDVRSGRPNGPTARPDALGLDADAPLVGSVDLFHVAGQAWDGTRPIAEDRGSAWLTAVPTGGPPWTVYGAPGTCRRWGDRGGVERTSTADVVARLSDPGTSRTWPLVWSADVGLLRAGRVTHELSDTVTLSAERSGGVARVDLKGPGSSFIVREPYFQRHDRQIVVFDPRAPVRVDPGAYWDALVVVIARPDPAGGWAEAVSCVQEAGGPAEVAVDPALVDGWSTETPVHLMVGRANRATTDGLDAMRVFWLVGLVTLAAG